MRRRAHLENVGFPPVVVREILRMNNKLLEEGFVARVVCSSQPFDPESCGTGSVVPIIDIVHVDDLTVPNVAASPAALRRALDTLMISSISLFTPLGVVINWNPGETGVMLKFRGSGSVDEYEKLRSENGFGVPIQRTDLRVNVIMFVDKRASCAMPGYVPLAGRVFSSPFIDVMSKRTFARALIESSLLHLAHVRLSS